ncbi:MAG: hypothetical protein ABIP06_11660 [Pyrinomonadaceae bacterium]
MKTFIISLLFIVGLLTTACPAPCDMKDEEVKNIHAELAPVAQAIEGFKKEQKIYPHNLNELSPKYLDKMPPTVGGRKFEYIRTSDDKYTLRIEAKNGGNYSGSCSYEDVEDQWKGLSK